MAQGGRRINIWLSEDENKRLDQMTSETGKSKSEILKQSLYQQRRVIREEIKKYADYQICE